MFHDPILCRVVQVSKLIQCTSSFLIEANEVSDGLSTPPVEPNSRFHRRTLQQRVKDFRHVLELETTMLWSAMDLQHVACGFAPRDVLKPTWHQDPQEEALGKGYVS